MASPGDAVYVGLLLVDCVVGAGHSLKEKRSVLRRAMARIRRDFNVSIAEVEFQDKWQRARLAIAYVNSEGSEGAKMLNQVRRALEGDVQLQVLDSEITRLG